MDAHYLNRPKQLKRILTKWNLKKKIGAADMEAMLATRRQRGAEGKATQFTYYEHIVDDRKLDRAAKRLKLASTASNGDQRSSKFSLPILNV